MKTVLSLVMVVSLLFGRRASAGHLPPMDEDIPVGLRSAAFAMG
ncbi:MAG: hypothetical protein QM446_04975 [Synergistota bacterium]|nr:hypothetical protein [Synergistota bacterium]